MQKNKCVCFNETIWLIVTVIEMVRKVDHIRTTKIDPDLGTDIKYST